MIADVTIAATDVDGMHRISADGWGGQILRMSRLVFEAGPRNRKLPSRAVVYILYADHFDKSRHGKELYVGQSDGVEVRLESHIANKKYWNRVLIFSSDDDWMTVAFAHNIEQQFILWAKQANRYEIINGNDGGAKSLGQADRKTLETYLSGVRRVLELANIDIFDFNFDGAYHYRRESCGERYVGSVRLESVEPKLVRILAGSKFAGIREDELIRANFGSAMRRNGNCIDFIQDVVVEVEGSNILPRILGISLTQFKSSCGAGLSKAFDSA